jgi:hypothetical protein
MLYIGMEWRIYKRNLGTQPWIQTKLEPVSLPQEIYILGPSSFYVQFVPKYFYTSFS